MTAAAFHYHAPATVDEAVSLIGRYGDEAKLLAGGQSLAPLLSSRLAQPAHVIDINRMARAERPTVQAGRLRIPPLMRHVDLEAGEGDGPLGALLAHLSRTVAPWPVRMRGTVCGALAHADPAGTWPLAAVVLGAEMVLRSSARGVRNVPSDRFFDGPMATALTDDEMLVEVQVPLLPRTVGWGFEAVRERQVAYPLAAALAVLTPEGERIASARIGIGGVEAVPRRLVGAERTLIGRPADGALVRRAADEAAREVQPATSDRASAAYQRDLVRACVLRALAAAVEPTS